MAGDRRAVVPDPKRAGSVADQRISFHRRRQAARSFTGTSSSPPPAPCPTTIKVGNQDNNSFLLGVRYAFNVAAPVPVAPVAQTAPAPAPARSYLVFFDWDKATLTDRARQVVKEAADNSTSVQYTRIEVNGYTDTSGTHQYNQGLSVRRARGGAGRTGASDGVPQAAITIQGFGDTNLLVPTGPAYVSRRTAGRDHHPLTGSLIPIAADAGAAY